MFRKKTFIVIVGVVISSSVALASFVEAFAENERRSAVGQAQQDTATTVGGTKQKGSLASIPEFKLWLSSYKGATSAEKAIAFGMLEQNASKAEKYFGAACSKGDERGCFQLALNQIAQTKAEGLDTLSMLATKGKNQELSLKSAQMLGAYILDFAPNNRNAVFQGLEAVMPHAVTGDTSSQFIAAHLFAANGIMKEADEMLTKACSNPNAEPNVIEYCRDGTNIEMVKEDGTVIDSAKKEQGECGK